MYASHKKEMPISTVSVREYLTCLFTDADPGKSRLSRRAHLRSKFGFDCDCALCALSGAALDASDTCQRRIGEIDVVLDAAPGGRDGHAQVVLLVSEKLRLFKSEGIPEAWVYMDMVSAFTHLCSKGDYDTARTWMHRAINAARTILGDDSPTVNDLNGIMNPSSSRPLHLSPPPSPPGPSTSASPTPPAPSFLQGAMPSGPNHHLIRAIGVPTSGVADLAMVRNQLLSTQFDYSRLGIDMQRSIKCHAEQRLRDHNFESFMAHDDGKIGAKRTDPPASASQDKDAVWIVREVLTAESCETIRKAVDAAIHARGGWDRDRHRRYPTTDLPLSAVPAVEMRVRELVFQRIIEPLTTFYCGTASLPENLEVRDCFYAKYSAQMGEQRMLKRHADASLFSFNVLLSDPCLDFEGGGTFFETTGWTVRAPQGAAIVHSGSVLHGGFPILIGERYLIVGFVEVMRGPAYSVSDPETAAADAFAKFGHSAWTRSKTAPAQIMPERLYEDSQEVHLIGLATSRSEITLKPCEPRC